MIAFTPHTGSVTALAFNPDGTRLASVSSDRGIKVWDVAHLGSANPVWEVKQAHKGGISHAQYAPNGSVLYTGGSDGLMKAWDARNGKPRGQTDPEADPEAEVGSVNAFVVSRCGKFIAYGGGMIWPMRTEFVVAKASNFATIRRVPGHTSAVGVFVAQEKGFVTGSADWTVRLWDWKSTKQHGIIKLRGVIHGLSTSPDGRQIAVAGGAIIHLYVAFPVGTPYLRGNPDKVRELRGHTKQVRCIEFSPDGTLRIWDAASGSEIRAFAPKVGQLHSVAFAPDGLTLAFGSEKGHVGILDVGG